MTSLDNFGFELDDGYNDNGDIVQDEVQKNLVFQMRRFPVNSKQRKGDFVFQRNKTSIVLPEKIFSEVNSICFS